MMITVNATNFRKDIFSFLSQAIRYNETVNISTKEGNAVVLSEEEYNGLIESLYLSSCPETKQQILEGLETPINECLTEDEVQW